MRLLKRGKDEPSLIAEEVPLSPSVAANVLPGQPLPDWALRTIYANASAAPARTRPVASAVDSDLVAGAASVAQISLLAGSAAAWSWQQSTGPSPEDLISSVRLLPNSVDPEPEPDPTKLPDSGLDIPVAPPEFLLVDEEPDQPDHSPIPVWSEPEASISPQPSAPEESWVTDSWSEDPIPVAPAQPSQSADEDDLWAALAQAAEESRVEGGIVPNQSPALDDAADVKDD